jgi:aryl-alcohol dehydrogenase-like predicted oxidoreductase
VNLFDTADVYARGAGEVALGKAISSLRSEHLVLASKCFFPMSDDVNDRGLSRKHVVESLHGSLRRLATDYLDLYQCHRHDPDTPLEETATAMADLIRQGKVLYWGVSQWPAAEIAAAVTWCRGQGLPVPISNQPLYNLFDRGIETDVLPVAAEHGVGQIVYSPLAQGVLTGKYTESTTPAADTRAGNAKANQFIGRYLTPEHLARVAGLRRVAARVGVSCAQVALAFCLRRDEVASVIVGCTRASQLDDNVAAAELDLAADVIAELETLFPV